MLFGEYPMTIVQTLPFAAAAAAGIMTLTIAAKTNILKSNSIWLIPAIFSGLFLAWSLFAIFSEGLLGFWAEHTRNIWGNQIWFDLLLSITVAWSLIVPRAKVAGMRVLLWLALISLIGSIGLLAMLSRVFYLESKADIAN
jgi:hypothetical protein